MKHQEGYFKGNGGINLYYQSWRPLDNPHAIVVIVHGLGSHSNLFGNIAQYLVKAGYAVYGLDLRGHGRSQGQRGHINSWSQYREDIQTFLKLIELQEPKSPCFLLGHSLGAIIALDYVLRLASSVKGIITMAPPLGKVGISPVKMNLGRTLSAVMPRFALSVGLAGDQITRDQNVQETFTTDVLMHSRGSARLATEFLAAKTWIQSHTAFLRVPVLILHGGSDSVAPPEGSRIFFQQIAFPDKERYEYPQSRHALHRDLDYQSVLADLGDWLERHVKGGTVIPFTPRSNSNEYMLG